MGIKHSLTKLSTMIKLHIAIILLTLAIAENTKNYLLETVDQVDSTKSSSERLIGKTISEARSLIEREDIFHDGIQVTSIGSGMVLGQEREHGRLNVGFVKGKIFRIFGIFDVTRSNSERLIGKTIPEAKSLIGIIRGNIFHKGIQVASIRVVERDGKDLGRPVTLGFYYHT